jgi:nucleotide-binding universal stress UspA family protein
MFEHIVVPLDGTRMAEQALSPAVSLAREKGAHLHLATVQRSENSDLEPLIDILDNDYLERIAARVRDGGVVDISTQLLRGDKVADALESHRKNVGAGLTVMCTHGRGGIERAWLGSVADGMVRTSEAPVLLVRAAPADESNDDDLRGAVRYRRVLVALDGSDFSRQSLGPAAQLGGKSSTVYVLVHVVAKSAEAVSERLHEDSALARATLDLQAKDFSSGGYAVESVSESAPSVVQGILDLAERHDADLIAIATHGRSGVGRLILGSVADKVIRGTGLPVLVVRPREP